MAKSNKSPVVIVRLKSTESPHCYFTRKSKRNSPRKMEIMKYDPRVKKHVLFKECSKV